MRPNGPILLLVLGLMLAGGAPDAARSQEPPALERLSFHEEYLGPLALGPAFVHGVEMGDLRRPAEFGDVTVKFQGGIANRLCVQILSIDASYLARIEFDISNRPSGTYQIEIPTQYTATLRRFKRYQIAIDPILRDQCDDSTPLAVGAVQWATNETADQVEVLINSGGLRTVLQVPDQDGAAIKYQCGPLPGDTTGSPQYDAVCKVDIDPSLDLGRVQLIRYRVGRQPIVVPIAIYLQ